MEYPIGIEMAPDYLSYEVSKAAYKLVKEMMLVRAWRECGCDRRYFHGQASVRRDHERSLYRRR